MYKHSRRSHLLLFYCILLVSILVVTCYGGGEGQCIDLSEECEVSGSEVVDDVDSVEAANVDEDDDDEY